MNNRNKEILHTMTLMLIIGLISLSLVLLRIFLKTYLTYKIVYAIIYM